MLNYKELAEGAHPYMVEKRRALHRRPCLTGQERETTEFIAAEMDALGIPYHIDEVDNLIAKLEGRKPGRRIALRADTDALPVVEQTGLPFASEKEGVMHACGHDFHVANLLGVARALSAVKDDIAGTVYFCFQIGEERSLGALELLKYLDEQGGVDGCFGVHVDPTHPTGTISFRGGPAMAGVVAFEIEVTGRSGHGSMPWLSVDPIKPACEMVLKLASVPAYRFPAFEPVVLNPCAIQSGTAVNIIPEKATVLGNARFFRPEYLEELKNIITEIVDAVSVSYGVTSTIEFSKTPAPPVINSVDATERLERVLTQQGIDYLIAEHPHMGSDNFSEFLLKYGGLYCFGGVTKKGEQGYPLHNARISPDEEALKVLCEMFLAYTFDFLSE